VVCLLPEREAIEPGKEAVVVGSISSCDFCVFWSKVWHLGDIAYVKLHVWIK
jgi:hypothetical protein